VIEAFVNSRLTIEDGHDLMATAPTWGGWMKQDYVENFDPRSAELITLGCTGVCAGGGGPPPPPPSTPPREGWTAT
jgi:hypothetical protein